FLQLHASRPGGGFLEAAEQLREDALPLIAVFPDHATALLPLERDVLVAGAVKQQIAVLGRQLIPRRFEVDAKRLGYALVNVAAPPAHAAQRTHQRNGTLVEAEVRVGNEQRRVEGVACAKAVAVRTHSVRAVEAEKLWARRFVTAIAIGTRVVGGEKEVFVGHRLTPPAPLSHVGREGSLFAPLPPLWGRGRGWGGFHRDDHRPFAERQRLLHGFGEAWSDLRVIFEAVDYDLDVMLDAPVEPEVVGQPDHLPVNAGTNESAAQHVLEQVLVLALLAAHHRRQNQEPRPLRKRHDSGDDLLARLRRDRPAALRAVPRADSGVKDAQVIVNLGDGADGRARVASRRFLLNTDRRRQPRQVIDVGLLQLPEKLPG